MPCVQQHTQFGTIKSSEVLPTSRGSELSPRSKSGFSKATRLVCRTPQECVGNSVFQGGRDTDRSSALLVLRRLHQPPVGRNFRKSQRGNPPTAARASKYCSPLDGAGAGRDGLRKTAFATHDEPSWVINVNPLNRDTAVSCAPTELASAGPTNGTRLSVAQLTAQSHLTIDLCA